jgi:hypothetical protein
VRRELEQFCGHQRHTRGVWQLGIGYQPGFLLQQVRVDALQARFVPRLECSKRGVGRLDASGSLALRRQVTVAVNGQMGSEVV